MFEWAKDLTIGIIRKHHETMEDRKLNRNARVRARLTGRGSVEAEAKDGAAGVRATGGPGTAAVAGVDANREGGGGGGGGAESGAVNHKAKITRYPRVAADGGDDAGGYIHEVDSVANADVNVGVGVGSAARGGAAGPGAPVVKPAIASGGGEARTTAVARWWAWLRGKDGGRRRAMGGAATPTPKAPEPAPGTRYDDTWGTD